MARIPLRRVEQRRLHGAVEHARRLTKLSRLPRGDHREHQVELLLLLAIEIVEQRVLEVAERDRKQSSLLDVDLNGQRPVEQPWRGREPARPKLLPGRLGVDRGDCQQEVERSRDLVDAAVHSLNRFDEDAPPQGLMAGRGPRPRPSEKGRARAEQCVEDRRHQSAPQVGIETRGLRLPVDRSEGDREPGNPGIELGRPSRLCVCDLERDPRGAVLHRRLRHGLCKGVGGGPNRRSVLQRQDRLEWREVRTVRRQQPVLVEFRDFDDHERAELPQHRSAEAIEKRRGGTNVGRDEIGSVSRRHVERGKLMAVAGRMQAEEGQRPVDVHATAAGQLATHRCALLETVEDFAHPSGVCELRRSRSHPGQADLSRISSSSGRVDRTIERTASSASGSASPVHSSMKNFLNSTAMAQPVAGNSLWMKRVCSPRP